MTRASRHHQDHDAAADHPILIGTSGWSYDHWSGPFYPSGLPAGHRLAYYAQHFPTVEIDATFYRTPSEQAVRKWREAVPDGFRFAVKGSRFITQYRRIHEVDDQVTAFMERIGGLMPKLAVVLWQLPPTLARDDATLDSFLSLLAHTEPRTRHAVEFRHTSWLVPEVFALLEEQGVAHVHVSSDVMPRDLTTTAGFVYVRFHGTAEYHGSYIEPALEPWAAFLREAAASGLEGYVYFNNDAQAHAPEDAARLIRILGALAAGPAA